MYSLMLNLTQGASLQDVPKAKYVLHRCFPIFVATYASKEIKCTGDGPPCSSCQASALECTYEQARRDRLRESVQTSLSLLVPAY